MFEYNSPRTIHPRRFLDITWGSVLNSAKTKIQKLRLGSTINNGWSVADFNEAIRTNMPNIYVIDTEYLSSVILKEYNIPIDSNISKLNEILHNELSIVPKYKISLNILETLAGKIHGILTEKLTSLVGSSSGYLSYRKAAALAGADIRRELNTYKFALITDPQNFINNTKNKVVLLSHSFEYLKTEVNKTVKTSINRFRSQNKEVSRGVPIDIKVGDIFHSGHVGLYQGDSFLGINMPAQLINGIVGNRFKEVEEAIGSIDTHIEYGIQIAKSFKSSGILLDLGFQFTVIMPKDVNESLWKNKESKAIYAKVKQVTIDQLTKVFKDKQTTAALLDITETEVVNLKSSPNILEFITSNLVSVLKEGKSIKYQGKMNTQKIRELVISKQSSRTTTQQKPKKLNIPNLRNLQGQFTSLVSIQVLINQALSQQIKSNMKKPGLMNRTGRFAESAKVERMSQSREGMVTAFYSWMKNPYATFSDGGRQHTTAREPKTLISKSIREIAAGLVGNRLRAISL